MKKIFSMMLLLGACSQGFRPEENEAFRYRSQGADITVRFANQEDASSERLQNLSQMVDLLVKEMPSSLTAEAIDVEGLTSDDFYNIFAIGESYFLGGVLPYQNKMAVYSFLCSVYNRSLKGTLPVSSFEELAEEMSVDRKEINNYTIEYSLDNIYFVSLLEMLERQDRYFYAARAQEDLFRILFYPELLGFWEYAASRFGLALMFEFANNAYTEESTRALFGETISDIEKAFVDSVRAQNRRNRLPKEFQSEYSLRLESAMKNTKQSLMRE